MKEKSFIGRVIPFGMNTHHSLLKYFTEVHLNHKVKRYFNSKEPSHDTMSFPP